MRKFLFVSKCVALATFFLLGSMLISNAQNADATINNAWIEHNVSYTGTVYQSVWNGFMWVNVPQTVSTKGMKLHVNFNVSESKAQDVWVCAFFFDEDYEPIKSSSAQFRAPDGQLTTQYKVVPQYENTTFSDVYVFMPYSEIHFSGISASFNVKIAIIKLGVELDSTWDSFSMSR